MSFKYEVIPPFRYGLIENGVYRSGYPTLLNYKFLKQLRLKTIISVIPEEPTADLKEFSSFFNIKIRYFPAEQVNENVTISSNLVQEVLQIIINEKNRPVLIHCTDGRSITGLIIMCLRKLQSWSQTSIINEFQSFSQPEVLQKAELKFLEGFNQDVKIPEESPLWLWNGNKKTIDSSSSKNDITESTKKNNIMEWHGITKKKIGKVARRRKSIG